MNMFMGWTPAEYHRDPCPVPSLSASCARDLVGKSPRHAWLHHPRLGGQGKEATEDMNRGTIIHALVFGTPCPVQEIPAEDFRGKVAREQRDAARAAGLIPVLSKKLQEYTVDAVHIKREIKRAGVNLYGESERAAVWTETTAAGPVLCRGLMDHVIHGPAAAHVYDLKNCQSADPRKLGRYATENGLDVQAAAYVSAVEKVRPECAGRVEFVWLFAEALPDHGGAIVTVARPSVNLLNLGRVRWARACELWARCLAANDWPGYAAGPVDLDAPAWAIEEELRT